MNDIQFTLNGKAVSYAGSAADRLLDVLRDTFRCTSVKCGCKEGECGACSVLLDGKLLLLLGKDKVLLFQIFAVAVFCFFLQFQPVPLCNLKQHLPTGGIKGDFAVVPAAEGLFRVGQVET